MRREILLLNRSVPLLLRRLLCIFFFFFLFSVFFNFSVGVHACITISSLSLSPHTIRPHSLDAVPVGSQVVSAVRVPCPCPEGACICGTDLVGRPPLLLCLLVVGGRSLSFFH